MIEFFKNLSGINSSIISIIFAFILSKIFGLVENIENISNNINDEVFELEKLKIEIRNIGIKKSFYESKVEEVEDKYFENYLNYQNSIVENNLKNILKEERIFFLDLDELKEKILIKEKEFLKDKKEEIFNYIDKNRQFQTSENLMQNIIKMPFYKVLKEKNLISESIIAAKTSQIYSAMDLLSNKMKNGYLYDENVFLYDEALKVKTLLSAKSFEDLNKLEAKLEFYCLLLSKLNKEKGKISFAKQERNFLKKLLIGLYVIFIFGVIYPMSYIKYENESILDYSLYNNFLSEFFSISGLILFGLTIIVTVFIIILYKMLDINISIEEVKKLDDEDWILSNYLKYIKY